MRLLKAFLRWPTLLVLLGLATAVIGSVSYTHLTLPTTPYV